jgi:ribonuclease HII
MAWMIGIDEAGYGPNLGPLAVAASAWWVEDERPEVEGQGSGNTAVLTLTKKRQSNENCLYRRLKKIVSRSASDRKLAIADSKELYKPGLGLRQLERGVLVGMRSIGEPSASASGVTSGGTSPPARYARWKDLMQRHVAELACYADYDCDVPIDSTHEEVAKLGDRFQSICEDSGVKLFDLRVRLVYPSEFNELTNHFGTKGAALSHVSVGLVRQVVDGLTHRDAKTTIVCDKHGGRNRYAALLQHHFPEEWIETQLESGPASRYAWGPSETKVEICFRVKGEAELPVALASMTAKYHRELAMRAFNHFWCERVPDLKPTAGYPLDAKRFKKAISPLQIKLGIADDCLWRWR